jgi:hypothetical protein
MLRLAGWSAAFLAISCASVLAQEPPKVEVETVLSGLNNPCGVAVRPGTVEKHDVYVSESGALRVIKMASDQPGKATEVITDFPKGTIKGAQEFTIGPLGLLFLNRKQLLVGGGGQSDGEEIVALYELQDDGNVLTADQMTQKTGPVVGSEKSKTGEGDFFALAGSGEAIFVSSHGDGEKGWILRARTRAGELGALEPFISTREVAGAIAPGGLTINPKPRKGYLVVGEMGATDEPGDGLLTFYSPYTGEMPLKLETDLLDCTGLAYSPKTGYLYAIDYARSHEEKGGLYRIDDDSQEGKPGCKTIKIASIDHPTALCFAADGTLYVTAFGKTDGTATDAGVLLRINGEL